MQKSPTSSSENRRNSTNVFHIGIRVLNLEASVKKFTDVLSIDFGPVHEITLYTDGIKKKKIIVRCAYSIQGPIHIELIEGGKRRPFDLSNRLGLDHIGVWSEEFNEYQQRKTRKKLKPELKLNIMPGDPTFWFSNPEDLGGVRVEFVNRRFKKGMEAWMSGNDTN